MAQRPRRIVLRSATELPAALIDEVIAEMATSMSGSPEAKKCEGVSFIFAVSDHPVAPARYAIGRGGRVRLTRDDPAPATFRFTGPVAAFDAVLLGRQNALMSLLRRRIHLHGSLAHIRDLLRMMPSVTRAYSQARSDMMERHSGEYDFRF